MPTAVNRREVLGAAAAALAVAASGAPAAAANDYEAQIVAFTGGVAPGEDGAVRLDLPELAENGNTVPLSVKVNPPAGRRVTEILIVAPENPRSRVIRFRFSDASVPEAATRIRLAATQDVIAVAKLDDGACLSASRQIKVTIGGCGG